MEKRITWRRRPLAHSAHDDDSVQVAALCWRAAPVAEVLLVTSLRTRRWILPKGWPQPGLGLALSAAAEAMEEAGVAGRIAAEPIGIYRYLKEKGGEGHPCRVHVFSLQVSEVLDDWPEKNKRKRLWMPFEQAARRLAEPELRRLLRDFRKLKRAA
jgi:8-oxo-dGTP pyrophosphatase MutT (NUDIX family)